MSGGATLIWHGGLGPAGPFRAADADDLASARAQVRILVVDDEENSRVITARMLRQEGYDVIEASSADEALTSLSGDRFVRLAVIDVVMPGVDGIALAGMLSEVAPHCGVILMTGYPRDYAKRAHEFSQFPVLMKPFSGLQLVQQVEAALQRHSH